MSGETEHTPGPWSFDTVKTSAGVCHRIGADQWPTKHDKPSYACVYADHSMGSAAWPTLEANARLMAAAPDLLEALTDCDATLFALGEALVGSRNPAFFMLISDSLKTARAALLKAGGK